MVFLEMNHRDMHTRQKRKKVEGNTGKTLIKLKIDIYLDCLLRKLKEKELN